MLIKAIEYMTKDRKKLILKKMYCLTNRRNGETVNLETLKCLRKYLVVYIFLKPQTIRHVFPGRLENKLNFLLDRKCKSFFFLSKNHIITRYLSHLSDLENISIYIIPNQTSAIFITISVIPLSLFIYLWSIYILLDNCKYLFQIN